MGHEIFAVSVDFHISKKMILQLYNDIMKKNQSCIDFYQNHMPDKIANIEKYEGVDDFLKDYDGGNFEFDFVYNDVDKRIDGLIINKIHGDNKYGDSNLYDLLVFLAPYVMMWLN